MPNSGITTKYANSDRSLRTYEGPIRTQAHELVTAQAHYAKL